MAEISAKHGGWAASGFLFAVQDPGAKRSDSVRELTFSRLTAIGSGQSEGEGELHGSAVQNRDSLAPWGLM